MVERSVLLWRDAGARLRGRTRATRGLDRVGNGGDRLPAGGEGRGAEALPATGRHGDLGGGTARDPHNSHRGATRRRGARRPVAGVSGFDDELARLRVVPQRLDAATWAGTT